MAVARYMGGILTIPTYPFVFSEFAHFSPQHSIIKESYNTVSNTVSRLCVANATVPFLGLSLAGLIDRVAAVDEMRGSAEKHFDICLIGSCLKL